MNNLSQYLKWWASGNAIKYGPTVDAGNYPKPTTILDDFNGNINDPPNPSLWHPISDHKTGLGISDPSQCILDGKGNLKMMATKNADGSWKSSLLQSVSSDYKYGTYAASIKMPKGHGVHASFWCLGNTHVWGDATTWPNCGETDMIECIADGNYYTTIHVPMYEPFGAKDQNAGRIQGQFGFKPSDDFHVYWLTKLKGQALHFGIDNTEIGAIGKQTIPQGCSWEFDRSQTIIFSVTINDKNSWGGAIDSTTPNNPVMLVDWVSFIPDPHA